MELTPLQQRYLGLSSEGLGTYEVRFSSYQGHQEGFYHVQALPRAWEALDELCNDAARAGYVLVPCSAFRSFERQAQIVSAKFQGLRPILDAHEQPLNPIPEDGGERLRAILRFSALPGCSRHHWGADFDIFAPNLLPEKQSLQLTAKEYKQGSYFYELGQYLRANLSRFGFVRPYCPTKAKNSSSSEPVSKKWEVGLEPWHISHLESAQPWAEAYEPEVALEYLKQSDLPFAPYVEQLWSEDLVQALLRR